MKRIVCVIICAAMLLAIAVPSVFAEDYDTSYGIISNSNDERQSTIIYDNPSNYCVLIPETIVADSGDLDFSASSMNLHENESVEVYAVGGNRVELTSNDTNDIAICLFNTYNCSDVLAKFNNGDLQPEFSVSTSIENANEIAAAHYSGTAVFAIRLVENNP